MEKRKYLIGVLVNNKYGVLSRISSLFSRRGFNIDSLAVGETDNREISRMTICVVGTEHDRDQMYRATKGTLADDMAGALEAAGLDVSPETLMIEITGNNSKINAFIELLDGFEIQELVRTGLTGLTRR